MEDYVKKKKLYCFIEKKLRPPFPNIKIVFNELNGVRN